MNACSLFSFDAGQCAKSTLLGWVPQWFWDFLPYWPWVAYGLIALVVISTLWRVYQIFGVPGVVGVFGAATFILGFVLGKRTAVHVVPHPTTGQPTVKFPGQSKPVVVRKPAAVKPAPPFPFPFPPFGQ